MGYDKKIWKVVASTAIITIIAGAFVMRLGDWARGLNSEFIVYGQTGGSGGATGSSGSVTTVTQIIPEVAIGSLDSVTAYETFIILQNYSSAPVTASANFFNTSGAASTLIGFTINSNTGGVTGTSTFTGSTASAITIPSNAIVTLQSVALPNNAFTSGWGQIQSSAAVGITAGFDIKSLQDKSLLSIVGVAASPANMQTFTIDRSRNEGNGLDTGFAIVNTGTKAATLTATLRDLGGKTVSTQSIQLGPGAQIAQFGAGLFYPTAGSEPQFTGTNVFSMTFDGTPNAQFAAIALTYAGNIQASYPVIQLK